MTSTAFIENKQANNVDAIFMHPSTNDKRRSISFEFFPAREQETNDGLLQVVSDLCEFQPRFVSVTYGAQGSSRDASLASIETIKKSTADIAGHVTFTGQSKQDCLNYCEALWGLGVKKLIVLRGDERVDNTDSDRFQSVPEFIQAILAQHNFEIGVACYPEIHPKAKDEEADLKALKEKQDAGASFALSQFFFDNKQFHKFVSKARDFGITLEIIPGILPVYDFEKCKNFAHKCGSKITKELELQFQQGRENGLDDRDIAASVLAQQVRELAEFGYEDIHIYTLNRSELSILAAENFTNNNASLTTKNIQ